MVLKTVKLFSAAAPHFPFIQRETHVVKIGINVLVLPAIYKRSLNKHEIKNYSHKNHHITNLRPIGSNINTVYPI